MELEEYLKNWKHKWWNNRQCIYKNGNSSIVITEHNGDYFYQQPINFRLI